MEEPESAPRPHPDDDPVAVDACVLDHGVRQGERVA